MANCRSHCSACNTHFSSDSAFDAHRVFEEGFEGDWDHRVCADVLDAKDKRGKERFAVKDGAGKCAIASAIPRTPVKVWTLRAYLDRENPYAA